MSHAVTHSPAGNSMRAPISLEDRTLLTEEPFVSHFSARRASLKKEATTCFLSEVVELVEKAPGGIRAVEAWVNLAFDPTDLEKPRKYSFRHHPGQKKNTTTTLPFKTLQYFVKFYWYLFSNQDAMRLLRTQKLHGYSPKFGQVSVKEESFDVPMSPLTELSEDDTPFSASLASSTAVGTESPKQESVAPSTQAVVPRVVETLARQSSESVFEGLPLRTAGAQETVPCPVIPDPPVSELEAIPVLGTPVRPRIPPRPEDPECRSRGHPRISGLPALEPPVWDDTSLPTISLTAPSTNDAPMSSAHDDIYDRAGFFHSSSLGVKLLTLHPVGEPWFGGYDSLMHPRPLPAGIDIKRDPAQEESELLRLFNPVDGLENWLSLPGLQSIYATDEPPVVNLIKAAKPLLRRLPPIWAQSRQEVCESFEWFRSYQGGVYHNDGSAKGYFLSGFPAKRDLFACDGKIIVSHGGGGAESSRTSRGQVTNKAADDQRAGDKSVSALIKSYSTNQPVVLLIDDKYEPFPFDLGNPDIYMLVLGFYKIIHVWAEYQPSSSNANGRVVRYKFAFQWCEDQGEPWWLEDDLNVGDAPRSENIEPPVITPTAIVTGPLKPDNLYFPCSSCAQKSPWVFQVAWACLNPSCTSFWITLSGRPLPDQLEYNPEFLTVIDFRPLPFAYRDALLPKPPVLAPKDGVTTTHKFSRGWHCRKCGRLSCRSAWEHYQCPNCKDTHAVIGRVRPAITLMSKRLPTTDKFEDSLMDPDSNIQRLDTKLFSHYDIPGAVGRFQTFVLPDGKGKIHLIQTNRMANIEVDRIFEAYQQQASDGTLPFRRWPLRSHKLRGPLLTNYFSQNSGETYHYVGGADNTVPFDRAPPAVVQARELIEKRIFEALGVKHQFNEVLSAAYMEQQKMAFHSDSETGLGPVVAGLSMGSAALMHFRLLSKYAPRNEQRSNALTVVLRHGDVLVMEGAGVQEFYEHTVVPSNFRIAATARFIAKGHA